MKTKAHRLRLAMTFLAGRMALGDEYPDAEWRASIEFDSKVDDIRAEYDAWFKSTRAAVAREALPDAHVDKSLQEFVDLLDVCMAQVGRDPSGYTDNPHLYDLLHKIYLRLCHGNIPDQKESHDND